MGYNITFLLLACWAGLWIKYSWGKPFKTFLKAGVINGLLPLTHLCMLGVAIISMVSMMSFTLIIQEKGTYVAPIVWSWMGYSLSALILTVGLGGLYVWYTSLKKLEEEDD